MGYLGRYSLLDELGFERNALFRHADDGYQVIRHVLTSLLFQSAFRMSFASTVRVLRTFSTVAYEKDWDWKKERGGKGITISSFLALSAKLLLPRLLPDFFKPSKAFSTHSISLSLSSVWMISISRRELTSPSTWITSASSKARTTWKIPSTARTWDKKEFPRPAPVEAP